MQPDRPPRLHIADLVRDVSPVEEEASPSATSSRSISSHPALAEGVSLIPPKDAPATLGEVLVRAARCTPARGVVYVAKDGREVEQSYADLLLEAERIAGGLSRAGVEPGTPVLLPIERARDFVPAFWGCVLRGAIAVPAASFDADPAGAAGQRLKGAWELLSKPPILCTDPKPVYALGLDFPRVLVLEELAKAEPAPHHPSRPDDLALFLMTSGSTGLPKLVMQRHSAIVARSAATAQHDDFGEADVSLNWFPLDHVGGLVMFHVRDVFLCCKQVQAPIDRILEDPIRWLELVERHRATITWAPNFAFALINDRAAEIEKRTFDLSSLRFILNGGEAVVARQARRFLTLLAPHRLPASAMKPAWGMSETCSGITSSHAFALETTSDDDRHVEVGPPLPGVSLRIVSDDGNVLREGEIGNLEVKGPMITAGYYANEAATQESFTSDGWFRTGDLAFLRGKSLTITGRRKDVIIVNGLNLAAPEVEAIVDRVEGVRPASSAAVALRDGRSTTDSLAILFAAKSDVELEAAATTERIRHEVRRALGVAPSIVVPIPEDEIPRTSVGKIQRAELKRRLEAGALTAVARRMEVLLEGPNTLPDAFFAVTEREQEPSPLKAPAKSVLVIGGEASLVDALAARLEETNKRCVRATQDAWSSALSSATDLDAVVLLRSPGSTGSGVRDVLELARSLASLPRPARLLVAVSDLDGDPEEAALIGFVESLALEHPALQPRLVQAEREGAATAMARELDAGGPERVVSWHDGRRLVRGLAPVDLRTIDPKEKPFAPGALVLVTGGLGGVGFELSRLLMKRYGARVLIVGRTALPPREEWPVRLAEGGPISDRIRRLEALGRMGDVEYRAADVASFEEIERAVLDAEARTKTTLAGVVHAAGVLAPGRILELSVHGLDAALRSKRNGTLVLDRILSQREGAAFIGISSVAGALGGSGLSAYAAACSFQDAFGELARRTRSYRAWTIGFGRWSGIGMAAGRGDEEILRAQGYLPLNAQEALHAFVACIERPPAAWLYGLDRCGPAVRWRIEGAESERLVEAPPSLDRRELERVVAQIYGAILELPDVRPDENFFDLGGHSLLVPRLRERIAAAIGRDVPAVEFFRNPTVRAMVEYLDGIELRARSESSADPRLERQAAMLRQSQLRRGGEREA